MFFRKKKIEEVHGEELLMCPRCSVKMQKLKKEEIIIDVCKKCSGMWVDAGEMEKLAEMAQKNKKSNIQKRE